jgi:dienelactone hydrolase
VFIDSVFDYTTATDIVYGTGTIGVGSPEGPHQKDLLLDLYLPDQNVIQGALPTVILIPGGGFSICDKESIGFLAANFASRGYAAIAMEHRVYPELLASESHLLTSGFSPEAVFQGQPLGDLKTLGYAAAIQDALKAISWVDSNASTYNLDSDRLLIGGGSAGARVALAVGLVEAPTEIAGVLSLLSTIPNNEHLVGSAAPPFILFNGVNDDLVPISAAFGLADMAQALNIPFTLYLGNQGHDASQFFIPSQEEELSEYEASIRFFYQNLNLSSIPIISPVPEASSLVLGGVVAAVAWFGVVRRNLRSLRSAGG